MRICLKKQNRMSERNELYKAVGVPAVFPKWEESMVYNLYVLEFLKEIFTHQ